MIVRDACPAYGSTRFKKNGHTHNGKQKHQCKACSRQFVQGAEQYRISDETRALIELAGNIDPGSRGQVGAIPGVLLQHSWRCLEACRRPTPAWQPLCDAPQDTTDFCLESIGPIRQRAISMKNPSEYPSSLAIRIPQGNDRFPK